MKLLIELDEEYVKVIDKIKFLVGGRTDRKLQLEIIKAIKNGKALDQEPVIDKIRAEIGNINLNEVAAKYEDRFYGFQREVIKILDKYNGESEG